MCANNYPWIWLHIYYDKSSLSFHIWKDILHENTGNAHIVFLPEKDIVENLAAEEKEGH